MKTLVAKTNNVSRYGQYNEEFSDFISLFSQDSLIQVSGISFPLKIINGNDTTFQDLRDWKFTRFHFGNEFSTIMFIGKIDIEQEFYKIINDSTITITIYIKPEKYIKQLLFTKDKNNQWLLKQIVIQGIKNDSNESFFDFIEMYSTDINFIKARIEKDATKTYLNDKYKKETRKFNLNDIETVEEYLYKIIIIDNYDQNSDTINIFIKGEGAGYHTEMYFKRISGKWYLTREINLGV